MKYPTQHCLKREWNSDGSMPTWEPPEILTAATQMMNPFNIFGAEHFKKHLSIGGYNGDMSIPYATNEYVYHYFI
jgi:hypothetical protein